MGRKEMIERARSVFREILNAMAEPHAQLLQRDSDIKGLVETIVNHVENARKPENWPVEEYPDEFAVYHPQDKKQWAALFMMAAFHSREMADVLCFMRNSGCELIRDDTYGYVIRPVIGDHALRNEQEYEEVKYGLIQFTDALLPMLKKIPTMCPDELKETTLFSENEIPKRRNDYGKQKNQYR
jgi:hypothetical protein